MQIMKTLPDALARVRRATTRLVALLLLPLALVVSSCSDATAPAAAPAQTTPPAGVDPSLLGDLFGGVGGVMDGLGGVVGSLTGTLLPCNVTTTSTASKSIGPQGGSLVVGPHRLVVPPGALDHFELITATAPAGNRVAVEFEPHGLRFDRPTALTLSYKQCGLLSIPRLKIVYVGDDDRILQVLPSLNNILLRQVTGKVDHFSQYALAY
jgi:hypothetical protein